MPKKYFYFAIIVLIGIVIAVLLGLFSPRVSKTPPAINIPDYKNAAYIIDGQRVQLVNGVSEIEAVPGSASKIVTKYFGNELKTDLNNDEKEDVVFLVTQETGGSGVFYYAVAAVNTGNGYVGSDGYLLGDRIAPQTIELSKNPTQKNVVVVNYADRAPNEPMSTPPSINKSVYLKLDSQTMQWGIVENIR